MNYQITCVCGNRFLISDEQLAGHVTCPACKRALSPVVSAPAEAQAVPAGDASAPANSEPVPATPEEATKRCPYCGEVILAIAKKCKHCGEYLDRPPGDAVTGGAGGAGQAAAMAAAQADVPPVFELSVSQWDNFWRFAILLILAVGICFGLIKWAPRDYSGIGVPVTIVVLGLIGWFFYAAAKNSRCTIRPMRIETEVGVMSKDATAVDLFRVTDLDLKQGIVERILGIGTIRITSNDPNTPELILYEIPHARKVYKYLQQQVPIAARQRGAVYLER